MTDPTQLASNMRAQVWWELSLDTTIKPTPNLTQPASRRKVNINHSPTPKTTYVGQKGMGKQGAGEWYYTQQAKVKGRKSRAGGIQGPNEGEAEESN